MEKAIKQRLLGGLVLVAGAILFLPMLLDGAGAPPAVPPMPVPPQVPAVEQVAPRLDAEVATAEQSINAAHEGRTFEDTPDAASSEEDVSADAAAIAPPTEPRAGDKTAQADTNKVAADKVAAEKAALNAERLKAEQKKAEQKKAEQEKTRLAAESAQKAEAARKKEAEAKAAAAKAVTAKASSASTTAAATVPAAWVVQVASLSAKDKADVLVKKLRQKNYRAVAHQQGAVWKVMVGPELRRDVAESIKSRLAADPELKLSGFIQAYKP